MYDGADSAAQNASTNPPSPFTNPSIPGMPAMSRHLSPILARRASSRLPDQEGEQTTTGRAMGGSPLKGGLQSRSPTLSCGCKVAKVILTHISKIIRQNDYTSGQLSEKCE